VLSPDNIAGITLYYNSILDYDTSTGSVDMKSVPEISNMRINDLIYKWGITIIISLDINAL
jgi:hypothetical protein